jgi:hypothetical protein
MTSRTRRLPLLLCALLVACNLAGCGSINSHLSTGMGEVIPQWAGGLPADAPPRPGTAKYDEMMKQRERERLEPKAKDSGAQTADDHVTIPGPPNPR